LKKQIKTSDIPECVKMKNTNDQEKQQGKDIE